FLGGRRIIKQKSLSVGQRLVGSALGAAGSLVGSLCSAVGLVSGRLRSRHVRLQLRYLRLEVIDIRLEGLQILTACECSHDCHCSHLQNDRALHKQSPLLGLLIREVPGTNANVARKFHAPFTSAQWHQIYRWIATTYTDLSCCRD